MKLPLLLGTAFLAVASGMIMTAHAASAESWITSNGGCKLIAPHPVPGGTVTWSGPCTGGYANGRGILSWSTGDVLEGTLQAGRFEGALVARFANGGRYEGETRGGQITGKGQYFWPNGNSYQGDFQSGRREGIGTLRFGCSGRYEGEFHNGSMEGIGTFQLANGNRYEGEVHDGAVTGLGIFYFQDGSRYEGELTNGHREGIGRLYQANGDGYEGEFKHDQPEGHGVLTAANGDRFTGEFRQGHPDGTGIQRRANGKTLAGVFAQQQDKLVLVSRAHDDHNPLQQCKDRCGDHRKSCGSSAVVSSGPSGSREVSGPDPSAQCYDPSSACYVTCEQQYGPGAMANSSPEVIAEIPGIEAMLKQQHERLLTIQQKLAQQRRAAADVSDVAAPPDDHCQHAGTAEQPSTGGK